MLDVGENGEAIGAAMHQRCTMRIALHGCRSLCCISTQRKRDAVACHGQCCLQPHPSAKPVA